MKLIQKGDLWAGTESSLSAVHEIEASVLMAEHALPEAFSGSGDKPDYGYSLHGRTAIVPIKGPLLNVDIPREFAAWFGVATYPLIQESLQAAAADANVDQILLDVGSGGGAVSGVSDTAALIAHINDNVKPVTAFTDSMMASAAYWLGSSAGKVYSSKVAAVGSIGVIATHIERSKQLEDQGIKATVLRAGEYKALASAVEPLSDKARAQIQESLDHTYSIFLDHVAERRGKSVPVVKATMAEGRVFYGNQSAEVGLVDGTLSFNALISQLSQSVAIDNKPRVNDNSRMSTRKAETMSVEQIEAAAQDAEVSADNAAAQTAEAQAETTAPAAEAAVDVLKGQLSAAQDQIVDLRVQLKSQEAKLAQVDTLAAQVKDLAAIAQSAVDTMRVALGGSALAGNGDVAALLAEHASLSKQFAEKFPVGGVAAITPEAEPSAAAPASADPAFVGRVRQAQLKTR